ncbi:hypothetical protein [Algibacter sp. L3A6]|uniref:hypothetical protein n=1 Tax=Algibacter sp. L3A6 TaxID=2686366 RepID=UPI00131A982B|nr:hypothetical protein [Algibacter sp. L3A6]
MEKTIFKNKIFEYSLIGYLILLSSWNLYVLGTGNLFAIITCGIQGLLLILILTENKYAKNGIKIGAIILIFGHGLSLIGKSIKIFLGDEIVTSELLKKTIFLTIAILIYVFNEKYTELVKTEK